MAELFDCYKPLRNYLSKTDLVQGLGVIRWYLNFMQLNIPPKIPSDLEVDPRFLREGMNYIQPWDLAVVARELIINSDQSTNKYDFRKSRHLYGALNKVKDIDNFIAENYIDKSPSAVMHWLSKIIPFQQFGWQSNKPNYDSTNRYYMIFATDELKQLFLEEFEISLEAYFLVSMLIWNNFVQHLGLNYPPKLQFKSKEITLATYDKALEHFSLKLSDLKKELTDPENRKIDKNFLIYYDSLRKYPVIYMNYDGVERHVCPNTTHLYWRYTEGIYYDFMDIYKTQKSKRERFGKLLGESLSNYVGKLLSDKNIVKSKRVTDVDSVITTSDPKADWVITEADEAVFVECKTKRMALIAQQEFTLDINTKSELKKLSEAVIQCYEAMSEAISKKHPYLKGSKKYRPIVVTMENWQIWGEIAVALDKIVSDEAKVRGVAQEFIDENPYVVMSLPDFENYTRLMRKMPLSDIFKDLYLPGYKRFNVKERFIDLFPGKMKNEDLFTEYPLDIALTKLTGVDIAGGRAKIKQTESR